jgi:Ca2+-binding EF-hand superfamily protein
MWFSAADADHDGRLSKAEFRADADLFFQVLDRDHDGVVAGVEVTSTSSASPRKSSRAPAMRPPTPTC